MFISTQTISKSVFLIVLGSLIVDIGGAFGLKYGAMALLLAWVLVLIVLAGIRKDLWLEFVVLLYFMFSACYAAIRGVDLSSIYSQLSFVVYFFLLFVVLNTPHGVASRTFRHVMVFASLIVFATFLSILLFPASAVLWHAFGDTYRLGFLGLQPIADQTFPNVYYRWSMWLIPAFIISIGWHRVAAVLIGGAALITLSTSVIVFTVLGTLILVVLLHEQQSYRLSSLGLLAIMMVAVLFVSDSAYSIAGLVYENVTSKFSATSFSTSVKLGHIEGVMQSLQSSTAFTLFGMGAGSAFYSPGIGDYTINIEVSHFNFVRQFGLVGASIFFGYVLYVIYSAYQTDALGKRWSIALAMLFAAAGTNPLLMSPVFMVVLVIVRSHVAHFAAEGQHE